MHLPGPGQTVRALTGLPNNPTQATGRALSHRGSYIDYVITFGDLRDPPKLLSAHVFRMRICVGEFMLEGESGISDGQGGHCLPLLPVSLFALLANISLSFDLFFLPTLSIESSS